MWRRVDGNAIGAEGATALAILLQPPTTTTGVAVTTNTTSASNTADVAAGTGSDTSTGGISGGSALRHLGMSQCSVQDLGATALSHVLAPNTSLHSIEFVWLYVCTYVRLEAFMYVYCI